MDEFIFRVLAQNAVHKLAGFEERYRTSEVRLVTPREWKGTLPKALMAKRILAALTPQERVIAKGLGPDAIDAIGLGKWALAHPKW